MEGAIKLILMDPFLNLFHSFPHQFTQFRCISFTTVLFRYPIAFYSIPV